MLEQAKVQLSSLSYGDVCKRSRSSQIMDIDLEEFEQELLEAIDEEVSKEA